MYPFWSTIVEPALQAAGATRVVEIGALRGETTVRLLDLLGPDSELHVIDPVPIFDPDEHARRFPGRYIFHRDVSHNVLPGLPPADAALIDGDHNWYTVSGELRMLRETARAAGRPMPLLVMHDVCWPYGRRDLYYAPERIPDEHRRPHAQRGFLPGHRELVERGGLNQTLENALEEGGPENGVFTALEDFVGGHDRPLRVVVLPIYYGLALVAEQELLEAQPDLAAFFDRLESAEGRREQAELAESIRVDEQVLHHDAHNSIDRRASRAAKLYIELLKDALLNRHYPENEVRIGHLLERVASGEAVSVKKLGDPARYMTDALRRLSETRTAGELPATQGDANGGADALAYTAIGRVRLDHLERCLETIRAEAVAGDLVDCGVGRGGSAIFMRGFLEAYAMAAPRLWLADRFGPDAPPAEDELQASFPPDLNSVRDGFERFGLLDQRVFFLQGAPGQLLADAELEKVALLRIDGQRADEVEAVLAAIYHKVVTGGFVIVDDYGDPACRQAVDRFRSEHGVEHALERIDWSGACWRKTGHAAGAESECEPQASANGTAPGPAPAAKATADLDLSVIVVFHNMRREAARSLYSLTHNYQQGVDDLAYEVIVVENGSDPRERLSEEMVRSLGPEFRYVDMGDDAQPSPAVALNRGIAESGGRNLALMIDGAHVLTPGVLRLGMLALRTYRPAVVATQQWYVGPGQQNEALAQGYDRDYEDRLFEQISWPSDGYGLFEIGHFIGDRDWFEDQWESNCIFVPRRLIEQVGPMDESFTEPGGGFVNLDFFERVTSSPGVTVASILGEGSFHQLHGGTTTNVAEIGERGELIDFYHERYAEVRGRWFKVPAKEIHYVGSLPQPARRTLARRMGAPAYFKQAHVEGTDGRPEHPIPVPEELRAEFIDAFWRSRWQPVTWLGKWTNRPPTDLIAYQELIVRVKPEWVIETRGAGGGRAFFLASVCDLLGRGRVLAIDDTAVGKRAEHERITYLASDPAADSTVDEVRKVVGERPRSLVILGMDKRARVLSAFRNYAPLVPKGSYVVVEDTIVNGYPVWAGFGPGPHEAVDAIIRGGGFVPDPAFERYVLTFNPGGFLRRTR